MEVSDGVWCMHGCVSLYVRVVKKGSVSLLTDCKGLSF